MNVFSKILFAAVVILGAEGTGNDTNDTDDNSTVNGTTDSGDNGTTNATDVSTINGTNVTENVEGNATNDTAVVTNATVVVEKTYVFESSVDLTMQIPDSVKAEWEALTGGDGAINMTDSSVQNFTNAVSSGIRSAIASVSGVDAADLAVDIGEFKPVWDISQDSNGSTTNATSAGSTNDTANGTTSEDDTGNTTSSSDNSTDGGSNSTDSNSSSLRRYLLHENDEHTSLRGSGFSYARTRGLAESVTLKIKYSVEVTGDAAKTDKVFAALTMSEATFNTALTTAINTELGGLHADYAVSGALPAAELLAGSEKAADGTLTAVAYQATTISVEEESQADMSADSASNTTTHHCSGAPSLKQNSVFVSSLVVLVVVAAFI